MQVLGAVAVVQATAAHNGGSILGKGWWQEFILADASGTASVDWWQSKVLLA